ncbi:MAG TPA: hypothetical protein VD835_07710 [Pyrinomonadaceae bacterium]|nr:hypothetical protein [Pyrinomonadaceae bacterium]
MTEAERELIIKEARLAAVHDIETAFAKVAEARGQHDPELNTLMSIFMQFISERWNDVFQDSADRWKPNRPQMRDERREVVVEVLKEIGEALAEATEAADSEVGRKGATTVGLIGEAINNRLRRIEREGKKKGGKK